MNLVGWPSGLRRRFAKPLRVKRSRAGSNPVPTATYEIIDFYVAVAFESTIYYATPLYVLCVYTSKPKKWAALYWIYKQRRKENS